MLAPHAAGQTTKARMPEIIRSVFMTSVLG